MSSSFSAQPMPYAAPAWILAFHVARVDRLADVANGPMAQNWP